MNKKIFTLLATSLMLFLTAIVMNAQVSGYYGLPVQYLPQGIGKGAYHLKVSSVGDGSDWAGHQWQSETNANAPLLAMDSLGFLKLFRAASDIELYPRLREALWCVDVKQENLGQQPAYNFINKQHQTLLSVDTGRWYNGTSGTDFYQAGDVSRTYSSTSLYPQRTGNGSLPQERVYVGEGRYSDWAFSFSYNSVPLMQDQPLLIEIEDEEDMFLTFAYFDGAGSGNPDWNNVKLVKAHWDDVKPNSTSPFYKNFLVKFTLVNAAPRVLTAADFNTTLWTNPTDTVSQLSFDPDVKPASNVNVLAQKLHAEYSHGSVANKNYYMNFRVPGTGNWVYVADGDDPANWYNGENELYPIIKDNGKYIDIDYNFDFRLVYYPSEDSLIINVAGLDHIKSVKGFNTDPGIVGGVAAYDKGDEDMFNLTIWDYLLVRMQDLTSLGSFDHRVVTVADFPDNTRIHFNINNCLISDDRTTVPRNLYLIRDAAGRYLTMPLHLGDFSPKWLEPRENEDPMKTPSYQWLVIPNNEGMPNSVIKLQNREFDWVVIEMVSIYKTPHYFTGYLNWFNTGANYSAIFGSGVGAGNALVWYDSTPSTGPVYMNGTKGLQWKVDDGWHGSFLVVQDDQQAAAKAAAKIALTQDEMQKLHRTSPYIGYKYIDRDTLSYFTYSFNYLHNYSENFYLGPKPDQSKDTLMYAVNNKNHFELILPDHVAAYGAEPYGIGWEFDLKAHPVTADIAPLERFFYHFKENDYWNFIFSDKFIVLGENARYGFTDQAGANMRGTEKATFYLRFTYQPEGKPEYYTMLERIYKSSAFEELKRMGLQVAPVLKSFDWSHDGTLKRDSFGVVVLGIDDNTLYARAQEKVTGNVVSTFAVSNMTEPLYRRFNEGVYNYFGIDANVDDGGVKGSDDPRLVKIYREWNEPKTDYLYEDAHSVNARDYYTKESKGINYLSLENKYDHQAWIDDASAKHLDHGKYSFYLDTAYVNRGTGHIKPQYLIMVDPHFFNQHGCFFCGEEIDLREGVYGRYLINATDSARGFGWKPNDRGVWRDQDYIWMTNWERLVFVPAIHIGDSLYILRGGLTYDGLRAYTSPLIIRKDEFDTEYLHLESLIAHANKVGSLIDIHDLGNNLHKDYVFSMRFYIRGDYERFLIESEAYNRTLSPMIAPMNGGWLKWENGEMVISRTSYIDYIRDAERWNTEPTTDPAVANDAIAASAVKVIAGEGNVTILNAAGKRVTISNVLGQTVASSVLASDNATLAAPNGVLVVAVEGENAVKAVVK